MEQLGFVMTVFFMLLGPVKTIPAFAKATAGKDPAFTRAVAIRAALIATVICALVALAADGLVQKYHLSLAALQLTAGLVLLLSALKTIFPEDHANTAAPANRTALQVALSPMATPTIVPPAGVGAIMIFVMLAPKYPGIQLAVGIGIAVMMALNFLVMFFIAGVLRIPGLMPLLQVVGSVLILMQVALAIQAMIDGFTALGLFHR